ncbi:MAG: GpE family phage tail protein [Pseudomonadota bacterium]|nr:GpE family phage tail protein [Pseudomonadota bacterium]
MADIALVFHWPLSELCPLSLPELMQWRQLAAERFNRDG